MVKKIISVNSLLLKSDLIEIIDELKENIDNVNSIIVITDTGDDISVNYAGITNDLQLVGLFSWAQQACFVKDNDESK